MPKDFTTISAVWRKGFFTTGSDPDLWRKDECGAWMSRSEYGRIESRYGWAIGRIDPNGDDSVENLRPLQWGNYESKIEGRLNCGVTARGTRNVQARTSDIIPKNKSS